MILVCAYLLKTLPELSRISQLTSKFHALLKLSACQNFAKNINNSRTRDNFSLTTIYSWLISEFTRCFLRHLAKNSMLKRNTHAHSSFMVFLIPKNYRNNSIKQGRQLSSCKETDPIIVFAWDVSLRMQEILLRTLNSLYLLLLPMCALTMI